MKNLELFGKKIGMTREFFGSGQSVPVTVLKMEKARVISKYLSEKEIINVLSFGEKI